MEKDPYDRAREREGRLNAQDYFSMKATAEMWHLRFYRALIRILHRVVLGPQSTAADYAALSAEHCGDTVSRSPRFLRTDIDTYQFGTDSVL